MKNPIKSEFYEYAMQMEKDGEKYYCELAGNSCVNGIKTILTLLVDEEVKHFNVIAQRKKHAGNSPSARTTVQENVKNIFT